MANPVGGPAELSFGNVLIKQPLISEINPVFETGVRERTTLAGTFAQNAGTIEDPRIEFTIFAPSYQWLAENLLSSFYTSGTPTGNAIWNAETCPDFNIGTTNVHFTCEENDANDIFIYNGSLVLNFNPTYNESDFIEIEASIHANPDSDGNVFRIGTGSLVEESIFNPATETTIAVTS